MIVELRAGADPTPYVYAMTILLGLFVARVAGQALAATVRPRWLPPMARWYSGLMAYRFLLPAQLFIIGLMVAMIVGVTRETGLFGGRRGTLGVVALWASYVYAAAMGWRASHRILQPAERRGVVIPIVFHLVLAAFLFVFGSWHA